MNPPRINPAEAAVAIVRARDPEDSVLLIRRAEREGDSWSGHWSFPGGRCDPEDRDALHTALRELEEECGVRLAESNLEAQLPLAVARRRVGRYLQVAPFVFHVDAQLPTVLDPVEAAGSLWTPIGVLRDPARHALRPAPGIPAEMRYPSIDLEGLPLWGFTYRLITEWLGMYAPAGYEVAADVVEFLRGMGIAPSSEWREVEGRRTIDVGGAIPVQAVIDHFSIPGPHIAAINRLYVRPGMITIAGPAFEEYAIVARG